MTARPIRRGLQAAACCALASLTFAPTLPAQRGEDVPGLLWGGGLTPDQPPPDIDPLLPTGPRVTSEPRPPALAHVYCGTRAPVCVHHGAAVTPAVAESYLAHLERAHGELVAGLQLPAPLADDTLGPTSGLDLYLSSDAVGDSADLVVAADSVWSADDRRSGFCRARASSAEVARHAGWCVAELILLGLDAAETPHLRRAIAAYLWTALGHTSAHQLDAIDRVQANPQLGLAGSRLDADSSASALLFHYADTRLRAGGAGTLPAALVQMSRGRSEPGALRWNNEPDAIDVLRQAFRGKKEESFDDFMLSFAVARAFWGSRDNAEHAPELLWLGDSGRVRFDWVIEASSLPRRVAPRRPLEPFGASYLWLALDRVSITGTLAFQAQWESPGVFRWTLVAVDAQGRLLRRYDLPYVQNATSAERTIVDYAEAAALLVVGTHLGGIDLAHPFDPDHDPPEPHGFTVYLAEL